MLAFSVLLKKVNRLAHLSIEDYCLDMACLYTLDAFSAVISRWAEASIS